MFIREQDGQLVCDWDRSRIIGYFDAKDLDLALLWIYGA